MPNVASDSSASASDASSREIVGQMVFADFLALLDERQRPVVVLLHSGVTKLTDVASILGYSNHSAISKHLKPHFVAARNCRI